MPKRDPAHMAAQRERIVRALIECIADKGVERTSIADICRRAGVSAGAIYVHFQNKDDIIIEALRYGALQAHDLPTSWAQLKALIVGFENQLGFDMVTVVRTRLHLHAECVHPGTLHEAYRPMFESALGVLIEHVRRLADAGDIGLKMTAEQTAMSISAFIDGMLWIALATDQPLESIRPTLAAGLDCFVTEKSARP